MHSDSALPLRTPSPYERDSALFAPKFFFGAAILVPILLIGGYVWWAINLSDQVSKTFFVGFLLVLVLLALLVVAVRDVWPPIDRTRKLVVDLENRARGTLSES